MNSFVINAENVSKRYRIGLKEQLHDTLFGALGSWLRSPASNFRQLRRLSNFSNGSGEEDIIWAVKDVSFQVKQGEVVGIIGSNGAGKSTLLKILSQITCPSSGRVELHGRVSCLLEVGTGFHKELTGRENIYLNGTILGMSRREVDRKFDEIVAFSEVEKFIDTPVKRYSSGMAVRLAFAVAAHLEPEILLVDEVLAVGDASFQKKCMAKMDDVSRQGRTVLFVSHNMHSVEQLCSRVLLLKNGSVYRDTPEVASAVREYLSNGRETAPVSQWENTSREYENAFFDLHRFALTDARGISLDGPVSNNADIWISIRGDIKTPHPAFSVGYALYTEKNVRLYSSLTTDCTDPSLKVQPGPAGFKSRLPKRLLNEGDYRIALIMGIKTHDWVIHPEQNAPSIFLTIQGNLSDSPYWTTKRPGVIAPLLHWEQEKGKATCP